jgi:hypothetical protein
MAVLCNATGLTSPVHAWKEETGSVEQETSGTDGGGGHGGVDRGLGDCGLGGSRSADCGESMAIALGRRIWRGAD